MEAGVEFERPARLRERAFRAGAPRRSTLYPPAISRRSRWRRCAQALPSAPVRLSQSRSRLIGIADGDSISRVNLLYLIDVDRIHRIDRTHDVCSINPVNPV